MLVGTGAPQGTGMKRLTVGVGRLRSRSPSILHTPLYLWSSWCYHV